MVQISQSIVDAKSRSSKVAVLDDSLMDSTEPGLTAVLSASTRLHTGRRLLLRMRSNLKRKNITKVHCIQKVIDRGKIIQLRCAAHFLGMSVNWS